MNTWRLALRNLIRNRRRSMAALTTMIIGVICILLFGGYSRNILYGLQTGLVRGAGHLQIQHKDYFLFGAANPLAYGIENYRHVMQVIESDPGLKPMLTVVTPTLQVGGIAGNYAAGVSRTAFAMGAIVADQNRMRQWNDYGFPGKATLAPLTNTPSDAAVVGKGLARVLQICAPLHLRDCPQPTWSATAIGPTVPTDIEALQKQTAAGQSVRAETTAHIELLAASLHGMPNVAELSVIKAEDQGAKEFDDMFVGLHLEQAQRLVYGRGAPQVTAIAIQLQHTWQMPQATQRLAQLLAGPLRNEPLEVQTFVRLNPFYAQTIGFFYAILSFIAVLIAAIVLFTIGNAMSMAVLERTVEIGTLRAIGRRRSAIRNLFLCEGMLLGCLGATLGVLIALVLAYLINHVGLTWTPPGRVEPVPLNIRVWGETMLIATVAIGLIVIAVLSAWWPARRAAKMNVVEALRHV